MRTARISDKMHVVLMWPDLLHALKGNYAK